MHTLTGPALPGEGELAPEPVYRPFETGTFRLAMGLQAIAPDERIMLDARYADQCRLRATLLDTRRAEVCAALPGSEASRTETFAATVAILRRRYPTHFRSEGARITARLTGVTVATDDPHGDPLEAAGRLVQEDLLLLIPGPHGPVLVAAVLCFPGRWRLAEKIGQPLSAIHAPVPFYAEQVATPVDRMLARLPAGRAVARLNWGLTEDPALFQPHPLDRPSAVSPENAGTHIFLRVERQTLSRLPASGAILFTIRVHVHPLGDAVADPADASRLAATIRALPDRMADYKGISAFRAPLLAWLGRRSATGQGIDDARPDGGRSPSLSHHLPSPRGG